MAPEDGYQEWQQLQESINRTDIWDPELRHLHYRADLLASAVLRAKIRTQSEAYTVVSLMLACSQYEPPIRRALTNLLTFLSGHL